MNIVISVLALVIVASASTQFMQRMYGPPSPDDTLEFELYSYQFHYHIYFIMTTISTVGFQNNFSSPESRILIIVLIFFAIIFVPSKSSKLINLLSSKSYYARRSYKAVNAI
jgi:hypothetical protein